MISHRIWHANTESHVMGRAPSLMPRNRRQRRSMSTGSSFKSDGGGGGGEGFGNAFDDSESDSGESGAENGPEGRSSPAPLAE